MTKQVNIVTLGCSKNLVDSEQLMKQLKANSFEVLHDSEQPTEAVIINTCGFIGDAKEESINMILRFCQAKKEGSIKKLFVIGCLSERYADSLRAEIPEVDSYFGTKDLKKILKSLDAEYKRELLDERIVTTPLHTAYLKIAEGCDRTCAFCAIPLIRGKHESESKETILKRAKNLVAGGAKELILISQDLSYYGLDIYKKRRLADLIRALSDESGAEWIRLHYTYPSDFPEDILPIMRERENICSYLDIPLQHISTNILKKMRRNITKEQTIALIDKIKQQVPDIALRTTLLVGHPGETDADFEELYQYVQAAKFDRLGVFQYSHEEDTYAYKNYTDDVPEAVKEERANRIMDLQQGISFDLNNDRIGKTFKVLIDRSEDGYYMGRTQYDSYEVDNEVYIKGQDLTVGNFYNAKITDADDYDLTGVIV